MRSSIVKFLPGVFGALLVVAAAALVAVPLGLAVAGLFLLALDRRIG